LAATVASVVPVASVESAVLQAVPEPQEALPVLTVTVAMVARPVMVESVAQVWPVLRVRMDPVLALRVSPVKSAATAAPAVPVVSVAQQVPQAVPVARQAWLVLTAAVALAVWAAMVAPVARVSPVLRARMQ
jgi:hypothetical protein